MRLIYNPNDSLSLLRVINVPRRGIGDATLGRLQAYLAENNETLFNVISNASAVPGLSDRFVGKLDELGAVLFELMGDATDLPVKQFITNVMNKTGYLEELENSRSAQIKMH